MSKTIQAYAIREIGWEYNDNWYEESGSSIEKVIVNKEKAEKICLEKNIAKFKKIDLREYVQEPYRGGYLESKKTSKLKDIYKKYAKPQKEEFTLWEFVVALSFPARDLNITLNRTDEEAIIIMNTFNRVKFYEVIPVEVELD